jgi:hypothetical protein
MKAQRGDLADRGAPEPCAGAPRANPMKSDEIARLFERVGDVLELRGEDPFRIRGYRRAAQNLETTSEDE